VKKVQKVGALSKKTSPKNFDFFKVELVVHPLQSVFFLSLKIEIK